MRGMDRTRWLESITKKETVRSILFSDALLLVIWRSKVPKVQQFRGTNSRIKSRMRLAM